MQFAELLPATMAVLMAADALGKATNVRGFGRWLKSGGLGRFASPVVILAFSMAETAVAVGVIWPVGRIIALLFVVSVTPLGLMLVRRTGACSCRGVVKSVTPLEFVLRNLVHMAFLGASATLPRVETAAMTLAVALVVAAYGLRVVVVSAMVVPRRLESA